MERSWKRFRRSWAEFVNRLDREEVPYMSHSKLICWERCPRCYHRRYVLGEDDDSAAMLRGRVFHAAASALYEALTTGKEMHRRRVR